MNRFEQRLADHSLALRRARLETLQINVGRKCNQACRHCHVDAGPWRTEMMDQATAHRVGDWICRYRPPIVDITGGAPELIGCGVGVGQANALGDGLRAG